MYTKAGDPRSFKDWLYGNESLVRAITLSLIGITLMVLYFGWVYKVLTPPVAVQVTTHDMPYIPLSYIVADNVTNKFSDFQVLRGGSGGIGIPQADLNWEDYNRLGEKGTHIIDITLGRITYVDTYISDEGWLHHSTLFQVDSPAWTGGYYEPRSGVIEGGKLILERYPVIDEIMSISFYLFFPMIGLFIYATIVAPLINRLIIRPIYRSIAVRRMK